MIDFVFPKGNEDKFLEMGKKLGFTKLYFVYSLKDFSNKKVEGAEKVILAKPKEISKAMKKSKIVLVESSESDRKVIEKSNFNIIFNLEAKSKRDPTHHRLSGLNQVLCKILNKRNKFVLFNFNLILNSKKLQGNLIGRMMQNVKLCRKYKVNTVIVSFAKYPYEMRAAHDLVLFGVNLGMHPKEAKSSLNAKV